MFARTTLFLVLALAAALCLWQARQAWRAEQRANTALAHAMADRARAEELVIALLTDFRGSRAQAGDRAALESLARTSLGYFVAQTPLELSDSDLLRQARALVQISDILLEAPHDAEAKRALRAAHARVSLLTARGPADMEIRLLRGRIEAGMAMILRRQGEAAAANVWSARQQSTMGAMLGRTSPDARWQKDVLQLQHELAKRAFAQARSAGINNEQLEEIAARARLSLDAPPALELARKPMVPSDQVAPSSER